MEPVELGWWAAAQDQIGLSPLAGLTTLKKLSLNGSPVSDLSPVTSLSGLKSLSLYDTRVTKEGVAKFQEALPNCEIRH